MILSINSKKYEIPLQGQELLIEVLRNHLGLTGTKLACSEAECGACTVLVNGKAILACTTLACDVEGEEVTTIEGLTDGEKLHPLQEAFLEEGAVQCGFCTPGMILSSKALLERNPQPTADEICQGLDGNICRCAGYLRIFAAVENAAKKLQDPIERQ
jgi:aerobic carbon-monoxide dehydrogenase small subunit